MIAKKTDQQAPNLWRWGLKFAASAGVAGIICCVAPMVLFMFGLMGGIYAISFADFFYNDDGSAGIGSWVLRGIGAAIAGVGIYLYQRKQNQCSVEPKRKRTNLILVGTLIVVLGIGIFLTLEKLSSWYFDKYVVPAQQEEYNE